MIRAALDGLSHGHVTYFLDELYARRGEVELVGIRLYEERERALIPDWFDGLIVDSAEALLEQTNPDVLLLSGYYVDRATVAATALARGVHVLADKPLATAMDDLDHLADVAANADAVLSVAFEKRWYPATMQGKALIEAGALGELRLVAATGPHKLIPDRRAPWFFDERYGSILADLPTHDLDLVLHLTDGRWGTVSGWASPRHPGSFTGFSDACSVTLTVEDRVSAGLDAHWIWPNASDVHGRYQMRLTGTVGTIFIDWAANTVQVETDAPGIDLAAAEARGRAEAKRPAEDFFTALLTGGTPEVDTAASLDATRLAVLADQSSRTGGVPLQWTR